MKKIEIWKGRMLVKGKFDLMSICVMSPKYSIATKTYTDYTEEELREVRDNSIKEYNG